MKFSQLKTVNIEGIGLLPLADEAGTFTPAGITRDDKAGRRAADGGFTEANNFASLELKINAAANIDPVELNLVESKTITIRLSTGESYMMSSAWCSEPVALDDGSYSVTFKSSTSEKL